MLSTFLDAYITMNESQLLALYSFHSRGWDGRRQNICIKKVYKQINKIVVQPWEKQN